MKFLNEKNKTGDGGFSLLEVILSIAVFTIGIVGIGLFMIDIMTTAERARNLDQGILLAEEGLEAVKLIRDEDFDEIAEGAYGLLLSEDDTWTLDPGNPDVTDLGKNFTRTIIITTSEEYTEEPVSATTSVMVIESQVSWPIRDATITISLFTFLTNWYRE
ncbi:MAG TPA: prepilin-type N-terminal cleavage/methylation domain-containing protein [Candidatus Paceibacterota bacterium]|nr:prepilin-type N-terminal cleavage/methylation domain-containing protein [Candidatus Paceibacterota bacterium]HRZ34525.1 prepilin-type N-terminal cleavage/methylation domain-containing protein [Candidatus Paceibacterota bacterium]